MKIHMLQPRGEVPQIHFRQFFATKWEMARASNQLKRANIPHTAESIEVPSLTKRTIVDLLNKWSHR